MNKTLNRNTQSYKALYKLRYSDDIFFDLLSVFVLCAVFLGTILCLGWVAAILALSIILFVYWSIANRYYRIKEW